MMYCIIHERETIVYDVGAKITSLTDKEYLRLVNIPFHIQHNGYSLEECCGPFTVCPPPDEFDLDGWEFIISLPVPDELELEQMDASAEELRLQFEG